MLNVELVVVVNIDGEEKDFVEGCCGGGVRMVVAGCRLVFKLPLLQTNHILKKNFFLRGSKIISSCF